jgi:hypothetical protein
MKRKPFGNPFANFARVLLSARPWRAVRELIRFRVSRPSYTGGGSWTFRIDLGRSAGYRLGRTVYVARLRRNVQGRRPLVIGYTRTARNVPLP